MSGIQGYYRRKRRRLPTLEDDVAAKEVGVAADEGDDVSDAVQGLLQQRKQSPRKAGGLGTEAVFSVLISGPAALFEAGGHGQLQDDTPEEDNCGPQGANETGPKRSRGPTPQRRVAPLRAACDGAPRRLCLSHLL